MDNVCVSHVLIGLFAEENNAALHRLDALDNSLGRAEKKVLDAARAKERLEKEVAAAAEAQESLRIARRSLLLQFLLMRRRWATS
jgi:hypothetical protein